MHTDSFHTSITRFLGGRPRFRRNMLSNEKLVDVGLPVVNVISLLLHGADECALLVSATGVNGTDPEVDGVSCPRREYSCAL